MTTEANTAELTMKLLEFCVKSDPYAILDDNIYRFAHGKGFLTDLELNALLGKPILLETNIGNVSYDLSSKYKYLLEFKNSNLNSVSKGVSRTKSEAIYRYMEYVELQEARANARSASEQAKIAIGISLAALVFSAVLGIIQLCSPVDLSDETIERLRSGSASAAAVVSVEPMNVSVPADSATYALAGHDSVSAITINDSEGLAPPRVAGE